MLLCIIEARAIRNHFEGSSGAMRSRNIDLLLTESKELNLANFNALDS